MLHSAALVHLLEHKNGLKKPASQEDKHRRHQLGTHMLSDICMGYVQHREGGWTGD